MKHITRLLLIVSACWSVFSTSAQTFNGNNNSGAGANFSFTLGAGATNLSVVISNNATAFSYLLLKKGGTPTDTSFDYIARLDGQTNEINLEAPEYTPATYGLRVLTSSNSTSQTFSAVLTTNRADMRSAAYPVLKPLVFSTTGTLTNTGTGAWHYFQVDMPSNLLTGWRVTVSSPSATMPRLYIRRGALPDAGAFDKSSISPTVETVIFPSTEATNSAYFIGVYLPDGTPSGATYALSAELASVTTIAWDPGTTDAGTQVFTNNSTSGGDYYFSINTQNPANGVWRTALNVTSGEADIYLQSGSLPATNGFGFSSTRVGSDGFVLSQGGQFAAGQNWYYLVRATPGAQWNLVTGEAYVQQLPALATNASSGATSVKIGAEGMRYFKTTITANTLAWRLGLNGLNNLIYVDQTTAPHPLNTSTYDLVQAGQMLVVPTYLNPGSQYFVGVAGNPGQVFNLDSRQQAVTTVAFNSTNNLTIGAGSYGYATYLIQVPVQQIAWQVNVTPSVGSASVAVRRDNVPNEFVNDAYSDATGGVGNSITLVPQTLSDGSFYVTVYGTGAYTCSLSSGQPVITTTNYVFAVTNDAPTRVGWRYYVVVNTASQLGSLGWDLELANAPAGTEIAIRRNAVPGRWNYRNDPRNSYNYYSQGYVDFSGTTGFLQQPNHQADVWYIGVYSPSNALGNFVLTGSQLTAAPVSFDATGSTIKVTNQPAGKFQYFSITVPPNALGWDVRLTNVTSGSPMLAIDRDLLPTVDGGPFWIPYYTTNWPSGYQWRAGADWTGDPNNPDATSNDGRILAMGMGNPLEPGTYYVGVLSSTGAATYTLASRGMGSGFAIPVTSLAFNNGTTSNPGLPGREAAYYSVVVPSNTPSWRVELTASVGESLLIVERGSLPNVAATGNSPYYPNGGRKMQKAGDEQFLLLPLAGDSNVLAGTYYLAVASEGVGPLGGTLGTGSSSYTLKSAGSLTVTNLGTLDPTGNTDLIVTNALSKAGQVTYYRFNVPTNTLSLEIYDENRVGNPQMTLRMDDQLPAPADTYGVDSGQSFSWYDGSLINIPNPAVSSYTLAVQAVQNGGNASYRIRVHAIGPQPVVFDGGQWNITNQLPNLWQYFTITVPSNAFGWDIRLTNVTAGDAAPNLIIRRGIAPTLGSTPFWYPYASTTWPDENQWGAYSDWTSYGVNPDGSSALSQILAMGMGNPLEPGLYYIGVISPSGTTPFSYTLSSRGIGTNLTIPVTSLPFTNGVISRANLPPREAAYFSVAVPSNTPSWRVELSTNTGSTLLGIQKDALPNVTLSGSVYNFSSGHKMQKAGDEQFLLMPLPGQAYVAAGTYYLVVAGEGMDPANGIIGTNTSSYVLKSFGSMNITNLGTVDPSGAADLVTAKGIEAGQMHTYHFTVLPNTLSLELRLENKTGNPVMMVRAGDEFVLPSDSYGVEGGEYSAYTSYDLINIANPPATNYTVTVQAVATGGDASYQLRVHAIGPQPVVFNGGTSSVVNQSANVWQYFTVTVPSNALGWDLRLTNVTAPAGAYPTIYVCRDVAPNLFSAPFWYPQYSSTWPTGYQWQASSDWTGLTADTNGNYYVGQILEMGMGNPLEPGNYYVGVINSGVDLPVSYTLLSRGIGTNLAIPVTTLGFNNASVTNTALSPREAAYYKVVVPTNVPDWRVRLTNISGESLILVQRDTLPNVLPTGSVASPSGGHEMKKAGNEQYILLPVAGDSNVFAGTYYIAVVSEGVNPTASMIGTNTSGYALTSVGVQSVTDLGTVGGVDLLHTDTVEGGASAFYRFNIPAGIPAVEVRLDDVSGLPYMNLQFSTNFTAPSDGYNYGSDGGYSAVASSSTLITLPNFSSTPCAVTVHATGNGTIFPDANFTMHVREMPTPTLAFDAALNAGVVSNSATGTLADGQSAFYRVVVPGAVGSQPVIGWKLDLAHTSGSPTLRVRSALLPESYTLYNGSSPLIPDQGIYVAPYLTPGIWYVEVFGNGVSSYTLTSSSLQLDRPAWVMPARGGTVTTPGLPSNGALFADTGVDAAGANLPGDQGTDLAKGQFDYYEIIVPTNNTGILRTRLDAISGNPNLYIRAGNPSSLSHYSSGNVGSYMYDRSLSANGGSEYGNWVPFDGRHETYLTPGPWYIAVLAGGNSNVRYRLRLDTGTINALAFSGANSSYVNQLLAAGDWLYYSVFVPTNAPVNWNVSFTTELGNVTMYVRDRVPPGEASSETDYKSWAEDYKNHGPYPAFTTPGNYTLATPPLRPGNTYYLGFHALTDSSFSLSDSTNGGAINYTTTIPFYGGYTSNNIPANGQLKFRIDVPAEATQWYHTTTHGLAVSLFIDQGSVPTMSTVDDYYSINQTDGSLIQPLLPLSSWPWLPGYSYFMTVANTSGTTQPFTFSMSGTGPTGFTQFTSEQVLDNNGGFKLNMTVVPGAMYQLQISDDLVNWTTMTVFTAAGETYSYTDFTPASSGNRFYRLVPQ